MAPLPADQYNVISKFHQRHTGSVDPLIGSEVVGNSNDGSGRGSHDFFEIFPDVFPDVSGITFDGSSNWKFFLIKVTLKDNASFMFFVSRLICHSIQ